MRPVVFGDGSGLRSICFQTGLEDVGIIVATHGLTLMTRFRRTAFDAHEEHVFIDLELKYCIEHDSPCCQFAIKGFRLRHGPGKPVEDEATRSVRMVHSIGNHRNDGTSGTRSPRSMMSLTRLPRGEREATASRNMSPVESCGMPKRLAILVACVPFPAPGGPNRTSLIIMLLYAISPADS